MDAEKKFALGGVIIGVPFGIYMYFSDTTGTVGFVSGILQGMVICAILALIIRFLFFSKVGTTLVLGGVLLSALRRHDD